MTKLPGVLMTFVSLITLAKATDYCSKKICNKGTKHIACGHSGKFATKCPADAELVNIDSNLQSLLVNAHNDKRNFIAGGGETNHDPACRMATMLWDDELASLAALNVRQCAMSHDRCHNTDTFKHSGQNIAWVIFHSTADNNALLTEAVDMWYSEVSNSNMKYIKKFPKGYKGSNIGHFTAMMNDRNFRVGCGAATYSQKDTEYKIYLTTCNYATNNMINYPTYGKCNVAASGCKTGKNPSYPNLCSESENVIKNAIKNKSQPDFVLYFM